MKLVGLTGGVGSGKSTVAEMMRQLGAEVVDADEATHAVYEPGSPGFDAVVREFGDAYVDGGRIDRSRLGGPLFPHPHPPPPPNPLPPPPIPPLTAPPPPPP